MRKPFVRFPRFIGRRAGEVKVETRKQKLENRNWRREERFIACLNRTRWKIAPLGTGRPVRRSAARRKSRPASLGSLKSFGTQKTRMTGGGQKGRAKKETWLLNSQGVHGRNRGCAVCGN